jgi:Outer membrane protein beta-barrel domain
MRRLSGLLFLLLLDPRGLAGQTKVLFGLELGYANADFTGAGASGEARRNGAVAGAYFRLPLNHWLTVQQGIRIASRGGATTVTDTSPTPLRLDLDLVYLDFPLVFRARGPALAGARLILLGGGGPAVRIGCNGELFRNGVSELRAACTQITAATFRAWDFFVVGGAGIGIPIEQSELALEGRLSQGLRSVSDAADLKNRSIDVLLSIPF